MIVTYNELSDDKLKVGMNVGVLVNKVIEKGEIISIEEGFVRLRHESNSVSAYQLGYFKFLELA